MPLHENSRFINLFNSGRSITYQESLIQQLPGIIQYLPLNELSGVAATDASGNGRNGTYNGVTLNSVDGPGASMGRAGLWDGVNDFCNIYSASLAAAFNPNLSTISIWMRVLTVGVWTDGADRALLYLGANAASNFHDLAKLSSANRLAGVALRGGTIDIVQQLAQSSTNWLHVCMTLSAADDRARLYVNRSLIATATTLGTWAGALASTLCCIGATNTSGGAPFSGYLAHAIVANAEWTQAQVDIAGTAF